jgi:hypothetical protein
MFLDYPKIYLQIIEVIYYIQNSPLVQNKYKSSKCPELPYLTVF